MNNNKSKTRASKKTTITFAIDNEILQIIREDAKNEGTSLNAMLNNILFKFIWLYRIAEKEGAAVIASKTLSFIIDNIEEDKWLEHYRYVILDLLPSLLLENNFKMTLSNTILFLFGKLLLYSGPYSGFSYYFDGRGSLNLVFRHQLGIKWSRVISVVYAEFIEKYLGFHTTKVTSETRAVLQLIEKDPSEFKILSTEKGIQED